MDNLFPMLFSKPDVASYRPCPWTSCDTGYTCKGGLGQHIEFQPHGTQAAVGQIACALSPEMQCKSDSSVGKSLELVCLASRWTSNSTTPGSWQWSRTRPSLPPPCQGILGKHLPLRAALRWLETCEVLSVMTQWCQFLDLNLWTPQRGQEWFLGRCTWHRY